MTRGIASLLSLLWLTLVPATNRPPRAVPGPPPSQARTLELVKELSIGATDGRPEYAFGRIDVLTPTAAQAFFIFDGSDTQIRRYNAQGNFSGLVGRSGSGPATATRRMPASRSRRRYRWAFSSLTSAG